MISKHVFIIYTIVSNLIFVSMLSARTIVVNCNGEGDFSTIKESINAAVAGDTIFVMPGIYF